MCTRWLWMLLSCSGILTALVGCIGCSGSEVDELRYSVGLRNAGTMEIRGASITFGEFIDKPGPLPANADSVTYAALKKIANSATVSWTRKDGLRRERTVAVKAPAPSRDHIRFWFVIDDNDAVTFRVEELKDRPQ